MTSALCLIVRVGFIVHVAVWFLHLIRLVGVRLKILLAAKTPTKSIHLRREATADRFHRTPLLRIVIDLATPRESDG